MITLFLVSAVTIAFNTASVRASACITPPSGLESWWDGDSVSGTTAYDIWNGNDGTMINGVNIVPGKVGNAFDFDGVDDYVDVGPGAGDGLRAVSFWFNSAEDHTPSSHSYYTSLVYRDRPGIPPPGGHYFGFTFVGGTIPAYDGRMAFVNYQTNIEHTVYSDSNSWDAGVWYHVVGVIDPIDGMKLFINGVLQSDIDPYNNPTDTTGFNFVLGRHGEWSALPRYFEGALDEVATFTSTLSISEIQAIYNAGSDGMCKPVRAVTIDIKPGSDLNSFSEKDNGVLPVAVLGSADLDVMDINPSTVMLDGQGALERGKSGKIAAYEDVNDDGFMDAVFRFDLGEEGLILPTGEYPLTLISYLYDGSRIEGSDQVRVV